MRPSKRELERQVEELRADSDDHDGFHFFAVDATGDRDGGRHATRDADRDGFYRWDPDRDEYVNENGYTRTHSPVSDFDFTITYDTTE